MRIDVYHHYHTLEINDKLDELLRLMRAIRAKEEHMSAELDELTTQVAAIEGESDSIIGLCGKLADLIESLKEDPAKLQALANSLREKTQAIADALTTYTPAA